MAKTSSKGKHEKLSTKDLQRRKTELLPALKKIRGFVALGTGISRDRDVFLIFVTKKTVNLVTSVREITGKLPIKFVITKPKESLMPRKITRFDRGFGNPLKP